MSQALKENEAKLEALENKVKMLSCLFNPMTCLEAHWMEMSQILTNLMQSLVKSLASLKETRLTIDIFINSHSNEEKEINGII